MTWQYMAALVLLTIQGSQGPGGVGGARALDLHPYGCVRTVLQELPWLAETPQFCLAMLIFQTLCVQHMLQPLFVFSQNKFSTSRNFSGIKLLQNGSEAFDTDVRSGKQSGERPIVLTLALCAALHGTRGLARKT